MRYNKKLLSISEKKRTFAKSVINGLFYKKVLQ